MRILGRNLRTPVGEVDVLAQDGAALVVVEVKTGRRADPDTLEARIDRAQRRRLKAAVRWIEDNLRSSDPQFGTDVEHVRCDWVLVRLEGRVPAILHVRDVFG